MPPTIEPQHVRALLAFFDGLLRTGASSLEAQESVSLRQLEDLRGDDFERAVASPTIHRAAQKLLDLPAAATELAPETIRAWRAFIAHAHAGLGPLPAIARPEPAAEPPAATPPGEKKRRPYQTGAINAIVARHEAGRRHHLIVHPTGTGKTFTAAETLRELIARGIVTRKTLVLSHRVEIVDQLQAAFGAVVGPDNVTVVSAGRNSFDFSGRVVIGGIQSIFPRRSEINPDDYDIVFSDEAHHVAHRTQWASVLHYMGLVDATTYAIPDTARIHIGMTATPIRADREPLAVPFTPDGIGEGLNYPIEDAIEDGYILRPRGLLVLSKELNLSKISSRSRDDDYSSRDLSEAIDGNAAFHYTVVQSYLDHAHGQRALVFTASVGQAGVLADYFKAAGVRADVVLGRQDSAERQRIINAHKAGELDVLVNFGVLTEGYDDPGIQAILMARPTKSLGLYLQMLGRGFRRDPNNPEARDFLVIDFTGVSKEHDAQLNLARVFGIDYEHYDRPDMDPIRTKRRLKEALDEVGHGSPAEIRARIIALQEAGRLADISYEMVDIVRTWLDPLPQRLNEALLERYNGDQLTMAFSLQMSGPRLRSYMGSDYPTLEREVREDFQHAERALGISTNDVVALWRKSQRYLFYTIVAENFVRQANVVGIPIGSPERLPEFCARLEDSFAKDFSEDRPTLARITETIGWARAQGHDVSMVDDVMAQIDPDYSPAWAASLEETIMTIMRTEHPTTDRQLLSSLYRPGNPLATFTPFGVTNLASLRLALAHRLYSTATIDRLVGGLTKADDIPSPDIADVPPFELLALGAERVGPFHPSVAIATVRDHLVRGLRDGGHVITPVHPLNSPRLEIATRWLASALTAYPESCGRRVHEIYRVFQDHSLVRFHPALEQLHRRFTEGVTGLVQTIDWRNAASWNNRTPEIATLEADTNAALEGIGIAPGSALFSVRLRLEMVLEESYRQHVQRCVLATFPATPPSNDAALFRCVDLGETAREEWQQSFTPDRVTSPVAGNVVRDALYARFAYTIETVVRDHGFNQTMEAAEIATGKSLGIEAHEVGPWITYFEAADLSRQTPSFGSWRNVSSLGVTLLSIRDAERTSAAIAAITQSGPIAIEAISVQPFPTIVIGTNDQDKNLWEITMRAEALARRWHEENPLAPLAELEGYLTRAQIDTTALGQVVGYFDKRASTAYKSGRSNYWERYIRGPVRMSMKVIDRLRDWHAADTRTVELLTRLVTESDMALNLDPATKPLRGDRRQEAMRERVTSQLFLPDQTFVQRRIGELRSRGVDVGALAEKLGAIDGDPNPEGGGTSGPPPIAGMPSGGSAPPSIPGGTMGTSAGAVGMMGVVGGIMMVGMPMVAPTIAMSLPL